MSMNNVATLIQQGFESSSGMTPAFKSFVSMFKKAFNKEMADHGCKVVKYNVGHFEVSGFYQSGDKLAYFSISDVRGSVMGNRMMYRVAKDTKDYSGGQNNWIDIQDGMGQKLKNIPQR